MRHLFVMDPLHKLNVAGDSTYVTMRECTDRGHEVFWCQPGDLFAIDGRCHAVAERVRTTADAPFFHRESPGELDLGELDVVWMRKDPPFDMNYVFTTYLLDLVPRRTLVVNHPAGLKLFNEKMWAVRFADLHPTTLVSRDQARLRAHIESLEGRAVIKPWDGNGGRGVLITHKGDRNLGSMLEILTAGGADYILCQPFIEAVEKGDKRILLFDGEPVGAMMRVPSARDYRGNMHVGATVEATKLTARDQEICNVLRPELKKTGQVFVGIDVIDGYLTEINVTSPTGIRELNQLYGTRLESDLVDCVHGLLAHTRES